MPSSALKAFWTSSGNCLHQGLVMSNIHDKARYSTNPGPKGQDVGVAICYIYILNKGIVV